MEYEKRIRKFKLMKDECLGHASSITYEFEDYLIKNGFFTAPASAGHHGAVDGGLFDHSYNVTNALINLTNKLNLEWQNPRSPFIVGMFHDLCKIDDYKKISDDKFEYNQNKPFDGHGDKSVMYLAQHLQLTEEEMYCIRWHMGAFDDKENWKYYSAAVKKYPNVLYTHTADMIASQVWNI